MRCTRFVSFPGLWITKSAVLVVSTPRLSPSLPSATILVCFVSCRYQPLPFRSFLSVTNEAPHLKKNRALLSYCCCRLFRLPVRLLLPKQKKGPAVVCAALPLPCGVSNRIPPQKDLQHSFHPSQHKQKSRLCKTYAPTAPPPRGQPPPLLLLFTHPLTSLLPLVSQLSALSPPLLHEDPFSLRLPPTKSGHSLLRPPFFFPLQTQHPPRTDWGRDGRRFGEKPTTAHPSHATDVNN